MVKHVIVTNLSSVVYTITPSDCLVEYVLELYLKFFLADFVGKS